MENIKDRMRERLRTERVFVNPKDALTYAVLKQKSDEEDLLVFKTPNEEYMTVHYINSEIAIQLGYEVVFGFNNVLYAAQSENNCEDLLRQLKKEEA